MELDPSVSPVLHHLVNKHVITAEEERSLVNEKNPTLRGEIFVDLFSQKGFYQLQQCTSLEPTDYMQLNHQLMKITLMSTNLQL